MAKLILFLVVVTLVFVIVIIVIPDKWITSELQARYSSIVREEFSEFFESKEKGYLTDKEVLRYDGIGDEMDHILITLHNDIKKEFNSKYKAWLITAYVAFFILSKKTINPPL